MKTKQTHRPSPTLAPLLAAGAAINFLILLVLITFSYLREEPIFWRNEGESPVRLRELVATFYYPLLFIELLLLSAFSGFSIHRLSSRSSSASLAVILLPMLWGLYFMLIANSVFNNLENLFYGRPLHWHPDKTWNQLGGGPQRSTPPAIQIKAIGGEPRQTLIIDLASPSGTSCNGLAPRCAVARRAPRAGSAPGGPRSRAPGSTQRIDTVTETVVSFIRSRRT